MRTPRPTRQERDQEREQGNRQQASSRAHEIVSQIKANQRQAAQNPSAPLQLPRQLSSPQTSPMSDTGSGRTAGLMGSMGAGPLPENGINDPRTRTHIPSVSEMKDPALNHRAFPDAPMNVTDAINSGAQVQGWGNNSGVGPGTDGYRGSDTDGDGMRDGHINAHIGGDTVSPVNRGAAPYNPLGSYPRRADGGPVKRASGGKVDASIQPMRGLNQFYKNNPFEPNAYQRESTRILMNPKMRMPGNFRENTMPPPQTMPRRREGGEVRGSRHTPTSRAGRTSGLSQHYNNQRNLNLERGARGAIDPITGLSHTPTQREINDLLANLAEKPTEFPGYGGLEESLLLSDYFNAKQDDDQQGLQEAMAAVMDYKNRLSALREQQKQQQQYIVNEDGPEAYQPEGGEPELIPGGEHVQSFPQDGKVIPANKTAQLAAKGNLAPPSPEISRAAQASEKVAPPIPKTEPSAIPGRTSQMMDRSINTQYGKGSVTYGPTTTEVDGETVRNRLPTINWTDQYDPNFAKKAAAMDEASKFTASLEGPHDTGEGAGFVAEVENPHETWKRRTTAEMKAQDAAKAKEAARNISVPETEPSLIDQALDVVTQRKGIGNAITSTYGRTQSLWDSLTKPKTGGMGRAGAKIAAPSANLK